MNVVIDVGNTRVKYAFFEENTLLESGYGWEQVEKRMKLLKEQGQAIFLLLSGSSVISEQQVVSLKNRATLFVEASVKLPLPLKIAYLTPETLGFDRIANCIGAMKLFPGHPVM